MTTAIRSYDPDQFTAEVESGSDDRTYLVDFSAEARCAPCRMLAPVLDRLAEEHGEALDIIKIDVDAQPALTQKYQIRGIPTLKLLRSGEVLDSSVGAVTYNTLKSFVANHVPLDA